MNQILLSALCGAAFIGGAVAVVIMVSWVLTMKDRNKYNEKLMAYWEQSTQSHRDQIKMLERIAEVAEHRWTSVLPIEIVGAGGGSHSGQSHPATGNNR